MLLRTLPGRAVVFGAALRLGASALQRLTGESFVLQVLGTAGTLALITGLVILLVRLVGRARRQLLWRVRRKLIVSYIFIGLVPALLIIVFFALCGLLLFSTVSSYMLQARLRAMTEQAAFLSRTVAVELGRFTDAAEVAAYLERKHETLASAYPDSSLVVIPVSRECPSDPAAVRARFAPAAPLVAGSWRHLEPPAALPAWVPCEGFTGLLTYWVGGAEPDAARRTPATAGPAGGQADLVVRAAMLAAGASPRYAVILDLPIGDATARRLRAETGIEMEGLTVRADAPLPVPARPGAERLRVIQASDRWLGGWVVFLEYVDWATGRTGSATLAIQMQAAEIFALLSPAALSERFTFGQVLMIIIVTVGGLFLLIQFVAVVMGLALARSITGSIHELFVGTVRIQQGDFSHRINVVARDQLGELASSFNAMTGHLSAMLAQMAEKKRLEEELRIARDIQMSLLPQGPVHMPGLLMTAHCSPAREVGGDYYDFLPIDDRRLGIIIADVSGKGTSAALYMAELKGLMLSLSKIHRSPRELLVAANQIIADNLDSRSFITMTYAVMDLEARTLTYARAGHTPLIHLPGRCVGPRRARVLTPNGLVLGLKIDGGERFAALLEEVSQPLEAGDLFVLFTDGITEAMNVREDLFGEERLGAIVEEHGDMPFDELRERILREVRAFTGDAGPHDDMTLILLKVDDVPVAASAPAEIAAAAR